jgi:ribosome-associated toxin RatA of RatAB toxin-antitoxin module
MKYYSTLSARDKLLASIIWVILSISQSFCQTDCTLRIDKDNVKVFACKAENSKIKSLKTKVNVRATPQQVIDIVLDIDGYNNWQYHTINASVLERKSETELIYYTEIVSPWPASNRDLVVSLKIEHDVPSKNIIIYAHSIPDFIPPKEGIVRVPMSKSQWTVKPVSDSELSVEFNMLVDPGGSVPAWLINMVAAEAPYESFRNFKNKIERR